MAGGRGFEPRLTESESVVLPLDDPPIDNRVKGKDTREKGRGKVRRHDTYFLQYLKGSKARSV